MQNKSWNYLAYLLLAIFTAAQISFFLLDIPAYDWLSFIDDDLLYQTESLLLFADPHRVPIFLHLPVDYGIELYLLSLLYWPLSFVIKTPLLAYWIISGTHILTAVIALLFLRRYLEPLFFFLFTLLLVTSPLFAQYVGHIKPDANVVFLCLILSFYFLDKFEENKKTQFSYLSLGFIILSMAIKWWGLFLIPIWSFRQYAQNFRPFGQFKQFFKIHYLLPFMTAGFWYACRHYLWNRNFFFESCGHLREGKCALLKILIPVFKSPSLYSGLFLSFCFGFLILGIILFIYRLSIKSESGKKLLALYQDSFVSFIVYLIFLTPLFVRGTLFNSFQYFLKYFVLSPNAQKSTQFGPFTNFTHWMIDTAQSGLLTPFIYVMLIVSLVMSWKNSIIQKNKLAQNLGLFLLFFMGTLFLFVSKKNWATQALMLPFLLLFIIEMLPKQKKILLLFVFLFMGQIIYQNTSLSTPPLWSLYQSRNNIKSDIEYLNSQIQIPNDKKLFACASHFPFLKNRNVEKLQYETCHPGAIDQIEFGSFLLLTEAQVEIIAPDENSWQLINQIQGTQTGRTGEKRPFLAKIFFKTN